MTVLLAALRIHGQPASSPAYPDSLQHLLTTTPTDTGKAQILFLLSDYWSDRDTARALQYINQYFQSGHQDSYYDGLAHFYLAGIYYDHDIPRSQQEYRTADSLLSFYTTPVAYLYRSRAWHNYGVLEQIKDNNRGFIDIQLNKAIPLAVQAGDSVKVAWDYKEVGEVFMNFGEYDKAHIYYDKALHFLRHRRGTNNELLADCYISAAKADLLDDHVPPAAPYLDSARQLLLPTPLSTYLPSWYWAKGMYYAQTGEWKKAIDSLDQGLLLARQLNRPYDESSILFQKYDVYKRQKNFADAEKVLLEVYDRHSIVPIANNKRQILHELAETEASLGNTKAAYQWLQEYTLLSDSLSSAKTVTEIAALEARYQSSEKEKEILELHNRSKIQKLILLGGLVIFSGALFFLAYRFRQKKLKTEQQLRSLQQQQQIEVASALLNGEERERRRLARDLHDGLGGMLAGIKINLSEIVFNSKKARDNQESHKAPHQLDTNHHQLARLDHELNKIIRQLDNSVKELRHIAHNLMPESLMRSGLEVALNDLCESVATEKTKVVFQMMNISSTIPKQTQILLYRIVQELLTNVLKHAGASEVFVQCSQSEEFFYITVEDDGAGFDKTSPDNQKGIGLENIRNRVDFLKGKLEIESDPGKGTIVNIEINVT